MNGVKAWFSQNVGWISDVLVCGGAIGAALKGEVPWSVAIAGIVFKLMPSAGGKALAELAKGIKPQK